MEIPQDFLYHLGLGLALSMPLGAISFKLKWLSPSGSVAATIMGCIIFGFGGLKWSLPLLAFFISSSLLSRLGKQQKAKFDLIFEKSSQRDALQVLANGGVGLVIILIDLVVRADFLYLLYIAAFAAAAADTWATEIGVVYGKIPRSILTAQPVEKGASGGITSAGLQGAIAGAALVGLSGIFYLNSDNFETKFQLLLIIIFSGLLGSIVDSILGATVQAQYRCTECQKITERKLHCGANPTALISGFHWINNDWVNFFCTLSAVLIALFLITFGGMK